MANCAMTWRRQSPVARAARLCFAALLLLLIPLAPAALSEGLPVNACGIPNRMPSVDPTGRIEGFSTELYNNPHGLPTSEANAIAETDEGFIWIGSYAGLIRHDGNTFERMDSSTGISSVISLFVDSRDRLWIGTNDAGVFLMDQGALRQWTTADGLSAVSIRAIAEDAGGVIYIATTAGITMIDAQMNLSVLDDPRLSDAYIRDIRSGGDGLIYGLSQIGDLFTIENGAVRDFLGADECRVQRIIGIYPDEKKPGYLYLGTENSSVYYGRLEDNFADVEEKDIAPLSYVERFEAIDDQIWICAGNGIGNLDAEGFHLLENVPMNNSVGHVMTDYEGNLWFTSTRQGVMKVVPNQFSDFYGRCDLTAAVVNSTCMYGSQLFIATDSGLTVVEDGHKVNSIPLTKAETASGVDLETTDLLQYLDGVRIRSIIRDSRGRLWIATWRKHGLLRYGDGELMAFTVEDGLFSDRVRTVCECEDGRIVAANTGGVCVIDGDRVAASYGEEAGIVNGEILTVAEGYDHSLILGSDGGGIYVVGPDGTRYIGTADGLTSGVILRVKRDPNRELFWIVTSNAIAFMTPDYRVTTVRGFPYSNNFDLYENSKGDMWVLASNGIYVTASEVMIANGPIDAVHYDIENGLPYMATANSFSELTPEGDLYIASSEGVVKVNIEKPFENVKDLKMAVPFIDADGTRLYPDESGGFTVPANTYKLTVSSFVYNYSLINPQVTYHLEGFDRTANTVSRTELAPADYTNLRGGTYHFVMRLRDSMGRGNKELSVQIVKEKKLYERAWFIALAALMLLLLLALIVRHYVRRKTLKLEKRQRETMTLISEITEAFAKVIDMKDKYTNGHSTRVAQYTEMLAREMGYDDETVEKYRQIALLHDIGKIGVPPEVLNKPGKLTDDEFEVIKSHSTQGYEVLKDISIMPELAIGAGAHHERPDGRGYPNHLKGDEIPRVAQIIAVADCFDAMYSNRPYRNRMNFEKVVSIIREVSGTQLAPDVVDAFLRLVDKGEFRAPDDFGGGSTENIENIRNKEKPASV